MTMSHADLGRLALELAEAGSREAVGRALAKATGAQRWLLARAQGSELLPIAGEPMPSASGPLHGFEESPSDPAALSPVLGELAGGGPLHLLRLGPNKGLLFAAEVPLGADARTLAGAALERLGSSDGSHFRDRALSTISHDLRGPLNVIGFAASMLKSSVGEADKELVAKIRRAARQMEGMIRDLLDLGELEAGRLELHRDETTLKTVLGHVDAAIEPIAKSSEVTVTREFEHTDATIVADADRLARAIVLLVATACRHTPKGNVTLRSGVADGAPFLEVEDDGKPIADADRERLFDASERGAEVHSRAKGLALTLTRRLAEAHEATIEALPAEGVRIRVTLPAQ